MEKRLGLQDLEQLKDVLIGPENQEIKRFDFEQWVNEAAPVDWTDVKVSPTSAVYKKLQDLGIDDVDNFLHKGWSKACSYPKTERSSWILQTQDRLIFKIREEAFSLDVKIKQNNGKTADSFPLELCGVEVNAEDPFVDSESSIVSDVNTKAKGEEAKNRFTLPEKFYSRNKEVPRLFSSARESDFEQWITSLDNMSRNDEPETLNDSWGQGYTHLIHHLNRVYAEAIKTNEVIAWNDNDEIIPYVNGERGVLQDADISFIAFDTRLKAPHVNIDNNGIYACMMRARIKDANHWIADGLHYIGDGHAKWTARLASFPKSNPRPLSQSNIENIMLDLTLSVDYNLEHITAERLFRFPRDWIYDIAIDLEISKSDIDEYLVAMEAYEEVRKTDDPSKGPRKVELLRILEKHESEFSRLRSRVFESFKRAFTKSLNEVKADYSLLQSCSYLNKNNVRIESIYIPIRIGSRAKDEYSHAVPIDYTETSTACRQRYGITKGHMYLARTIQPLDQVYTTVRLTGRPSSSWLVEYGIKNERLYINGSSSGTKNITNSLFYRGESYEVRSGITVGRRYSGHSSVSSQCADIQLDGMPNSVSRNQGSFKYDNARNEWSYSERKWATNPSLMKPKGSDEEILIEQGESIPIHKGDKLYLAPGADPIMIMLD